MLTDIIRARLYNSFSMKIVSLSEQHLKQIFRSTCKNFFPLSIVSLIWLCIKVGRGHWDAFVGTWDLGTRVEGRGDAGTSNIGDAEGKSRR